VSARTVTLASVQSCISVCCVQLILNFSSEAASGGISGMLLMTCCSSNFAKVASHSPLLNGSIGLVSNSASSSPDSVTGPTAAPLKCADSPLTVALFTVSTPVAAAVAAVAAEAEVVVRTGRKGKGRGVKGGAARVFAQHLSHSKHSPNSVMLSWRGSSPSCGIVVDMCVCVLKCGSSGQHKSEAVY
jgi:hypothetical protein